VQVSVAARGLIDMHGQEKLRVWLFGRGTQQTRIRPCG
jgi:hypothetical protein